MIRVRDAAPQFLWFAVPIPMSLSFSGFAVTIQDLIPMGTMLVIYIVEIEIVYMFDRECIWSIREQVIKPTMQQEATSGEILSRLF